MTFIITSISQTLPAGGTEEGQLPLSISLLVFYPVPLTGQRTTCLPRQLPDPSSPTWLLLGWQRTVCLGCWVPNKCSREELLQVRYYSSSENN